VDLNGFSAAARALGVPKAAVSRAVADLEKSLGVRVLERTTRRIALTHAGRLLYPHAKRVVDESDAARVLIAKLNTPPSGPLRVVADPTYGRVLLTPLVPRFLESFPDVPLEVTMDAANGAEGWDVAIGTRRSSDGTAAFRLLGAPPALLCATPGYLQLRGVPSRPEDLRSHDLLTPEATDLPQFRLRLERGNQRAEVAISPKLAVNDPAVLHASTAAGLGIGLLPEFLCRQGLATGRLKAVLPEWGVPAAAELYAVYPAALEADLRVQRFVDFLAANIVPALALVTGE
jgi:DNA-binding transcriptional LysR family regulator